MRRVKELLGGPSLLPRVLTAATLVVVLFPLLVALSHWLLPEGLLRGWNPLQQWEESPRPWVLAAQLFAFNLISVVVIAATSLFAGKRSGERTYLSVAYSVLAVFLALNAVTLGTWSFSSAPAGGVPGLGGRLLGLLDLTHRAATWEMAGQVLITCALAGISVVRTSGRETTTRPLRQVRLTRAEVVAVVVGLVLMVTGAVVEAWSINAG